MASLPLHCQIRPRETEPCTSLHWQTPLHLLTIPRTDPGTACIPTAHCIHTDPGTDCSDKSLQSLRGAAQLFAGSDRLDKAAELLGEITRAEPSDDGAWQNLVRPAEPGPQSSAASQGHGLPMGASEKMKSLQHLGRGAPGRRRLLAQNRFDHCCQGRSMV